MNINDFMTSKAAVLMPLEDGEYTIKFGVLQQVEGAKGKQDYLTLELRFPDRTNKMIMTDIGLDIFVKELRTQRGFTGAVDLAQLKKLMKDEAKCYVSHKTDDSTGKTYTNYHFVQKDEIVAASATEADAEAAQLY